MKFVGLMNSALVYCSWLTWSNNAAGTKKKIKKRTKHDFQNVDTQTPNSNGHFMLNNA